MVRPYSGIASVTIKSTYSLDIETVRALEGLARRGEFTEEQAVTANAACCGRFKSAGLTLA